ncbi:MAG TPA: hypothetical protein VMR97_00105, partial [Acidimicrobiales bacterium]|nr:hypothetical protein [Acidimicrobiales bacterium]
MTSVTFDPAVASSGRKRRRQTPVLRGVPAPHPWLPRAAVAAAAIGLVVVVALAVAAETRSQLSASGGVLIFLGSLTG